MMGDKLLLEDVRFYGHHGVTKAQQTVGAWFSVDAELHVDLAPAAASDDLRTTVDYGLVAARIVEVSTKERVNLLDHGSNDRQSLIDERGGTGQRRFAFVEHRREGLEDVRNAGDDLERDAHVVRGCARRQPQRVTQQDLVGPDLYQERR